jgi:ribosomal protein S18 acetylase RimI-like enzyme
MSDFEVREAVADDWGQIWPFFHQIVAAGDTYTYDPGIGEAAARGSWMQQAPGRTFVAVDGGTVLGSAKIHPNQGGPGAHVANGSFMVDARFGRRGVGRALAEHAIHAARADGYHAMVFNAVAATNVHAVRLYERLGFEVVATIPGGFRHPDDGLVGLHVMHLAL